MSDLSIRILQFFLIIELAAAFSSPASNSRVDAPQTQSRGFIEFTNLENGPTQTLPSSFVRDWPTWVLEVNGTLSRIPDEEANGGFVTPTSINELWQPIDLKRTDMKLALGLHVRSGVIRHVMPALDLSYDNGLHRNRGICSVPRAYTWVDFGSFGIDMDDWNQFELKVSSKKIGDDDDAWTLLSTSSELAISKAIERTILCLAEIAPDDLGVGSHIIHVVLEDAMLLQTPNTNHELRVTMTEKEDQTDTTELKLNDVGILQVAISTTASGSESEYLPDVYKPLYSDVSLKNTLYAKHKLREKQKREL